MSYIPVIDLTACKTGNAKSLTEIGRIVDGACVEHGFLILTGHGIERSLIDALICVSKDFFRIQMHIKIGTRDPVLIMVKDIAA